jgi:putative flippase GtrA
MMKLLSSALPVRWQAQTREIVLFIIIGFLNTAIDFVVLNLLIVLTHRDSGIWLITYTCLGFLIAVINSYVLHTCLTFQGQASRPSHYFIRFAMINAVGMIINSSIVWLLVLILSAGKFPMMVAINVSKVPATLCSFMWNYLATKRWVFERPYNYTGYTVSPLQKVFIARLEKEESIKMRLYYTSLRYKARPPLNRIILVPVEKE